MSRWMINARGRQFSAANMDELRTLARNGELSGGDIVQPPGASDWLYAVEVPELARSLRAELDAELPQQQREMPPALKYGLAAVMALASAGAWKYAYDLSQTIPTPEDLDLLAGKDGLSYSQVLVTADGVMIRKTPSATGAEVGALPKDAKADLLGKRDGWYRLRYEGNEGYAPISEVIPAYYFAADAKTKEEYDPLYNPDQYVSVANAGWQAPPDGAPGVTVFTFMLSNTSKFEMTDIKLLAVIKDKNEQVIEEREIAMEGGIPAGESVMIGTLKTSKSAKGGDGRIMTTAAYQTELEADPKAAERWTDGVEIQFETVGYVGATIRIAEVRAVPADVQATAGAGTEAAPAGE